MLPYGALDSACVPKILPYWRKTETIGTC